MENESRLVIPKSEALLPVACPELDEAEIEAVAEVIRSGWITQGPKTREFEHRLTAYLKADSVVCVSSCTAGLFLALKASGIGPGDEVIVPSYSFIATANAVVHAGATPVFADIEEGGVNLDPRSVEKALSPETKAILLVHQVGIPADIQAFQEISKREGLVLIEDAACAMGSSYRGEPIGSHSDLVVFSFHPRKILTTGEGGAIAWNGESRKELDFLISARCQGMSVSDSDRHLSRTVIYETYSEVGFNFKMNDLEAAIGLVQLAKLERQISYRRKLVDVYRAAFRSVPRVRLIEEPANGRANFQTLLLEIESSPIELGQALLDQGISTRRGIMATHLEPCYRNREECFRVPLPHTEHAAHQRIALPLHSRMIEEDCVRVVSAITKGTARLSVKSPL